MSDGLGGEHSGDHLLGEDDRARVERLAAIFEHSTDAIVGKTLDGIVTDWNPAAGRTYGWPAVEAIGRNLEFIFPPDRKHELADILAALRRGEEVGPYETVRTRKDGSLFPALVTVSPIRDRTGQVIAGSKTALDLSSLRRGEVAEEALRLRDEFLATVSHDLQQPLTTIRGQAQVLRRQLEDHGHVDVERLIARLATIDATARRMSAQIAGLLDETRLEANRPLQLQCEPVDLVALMRDLVAEYGQATDTRDIRLQTELGSLIGLFDPVRLRRLIGNLLSNAVKYSPADSDVSISLTREDVGGQPWAVVAVRDHGIGIPAADLPRLFERGFRAGNATRGPVHGTGLGLIAARVVAEQHGGMLDVSSREGEGSTFSVRLPL
jgi:PAS domain S-box-containing protein